MHAVENFSLILLQFSVIYTVNRWKKVVIVLGLYVNRNVIPLRHCEFCTFGGLLDSMVTLKFPPPFTGA